MLITKLKQKFNYEIQIKSLNISQYSYKASIFYPHSTEAETGTYEY